LPGDANFGLAKKKDGARELIGRFTADATEQSGQAVLVEGKSGVIGQVSIGQGTFNLRTIAPAVFAVTSSELGAGDRRPDDVLIEEAPPEPQSPLHDVGPGHAARAQNEENTQQCTNPREKIGIDVVVGITPQATQSALAKSLDVRHLLMFSEALANISLENSKINGHLKTVGAVDVSYTEGSSYTHDVRSLLNANASLRPLLRERTNKRADVTILVVHNDDERYCGLAAGARVDSAHSFAVVNWKCLTDRFSFAHEIGHLIGAWHDPATLVRQGAQASPAYAQGYITTGQKPVATIMGYPESCPVPCGRIWFWANPETTFSGQTMGTHDRNFDACVWRRRLPVVAGFNGN
jgi:hypothetical protein